MVVSLSTRRPVKFFRSYFKNHGHLGLTTLFILMVAPYRSGERRLDPNSLILLELEDILLRNDSAEHEGCCCTAGANASRTKHFFTGSHKTSYS